MSYVLGGAAHLIISTVMLRSTIFSKVYAYVGLVLSVTMLVPPTLGTIGLVFSLGSLVPLEIWLILIARRLFRLGLGERFGIGQYVLVYLPESGVIGWGWLWVVLALLLDLGVYSSPTRRAARARKCIR